VLRTRELLVVATIGITVQFVTFGTSFGFVPVWAQRIGASNAEVGYVTMAMFAASVAGTLAAPGLARRAGNACRRPPASAAAR
jgi:cyanate permease